MSDQTSSPSIDVVMLDQPQLPKTKKMFPSIASPTDNILSPCTQKLQVHRGRFLHKHIAKPTRKPTTLSSLGLKASRSTSLQESEPIKKENISSLEEKK